MSAKKVRKSQLTTRELASLNLACAPIKEAFGHSPYLVGSCEQGDRDYRDVDVRLILPDDEFDSIFGGSTFIWHIFCWAVAEWLNKVTGLPIDFQAQPMTEANAKYGTHPRNPLGVRARLYAGGGDASGLSPYDAEPGRKGA